MKALAVPEAVNVDSSEAVPGTVIVPVADAVKVLATEPDPLKPETNGGGAAHSDVPHPLLPHPEATATGAKAKPTTAQPSEA